MHYLESGITKSYNKPFLLDEDSLRRIIATIEESSRDLSVATKVVFHVERMDHRFYESYIIEDILLDPNVKGKEIKQISIYLTNDELAIKFNDINSGSLVTLRFDSGATYSEPVRLKIAYEDKNWALLLADKLDPQVFRTFKIQSISAWFLLLPFFFILVPISLRFKAHIMPGGFKLFLFILSLLVLLNIIFSNLEKPRWYKILIGTQSVFLWGDVTYHYERAKSIKQNFFWAVIVGFIISIASSFYMLYFGK